MVGSLKCCLVLLYFFTQIQDIDPAMFLHESQRSDKSISLILTDEGVKAKQGSVIFKRSFIAPNTYADSETSH